MLYYRGSLFDCYETLRARQSSKADSEEVCKHAGIGYCKKCNPKMFESEVQEGTKIGDKSDVLARFDAEFPKLPKLITAEHSSRVVAHKNQIKSFIVTEIERATEKVKLKTVDAFVKATTNEQFEAGRTAVEAERPIYYPSREAFEKAREDMRAEIVGHIFRIIDELYPPHSLKDTDAAETYKLALSDFAAAIEKTIGSAHH